MTDKNYTKWVSCWGTATSITERLESTYAKDLTLRYPIRMPFSGNKLRFRFSNQTGTEPVEITEACVNCKAQITFGGEKTVVIEPGVEVTSDEIDFDVTAGDTVEVNMYFGNFTQMNSGTLVTGPLSEGYFGYGNYIWVEKKDFPLNDTKATNYYYFLNTIDIFTEEKNHAIICYGDSITAQSWPDYLAIRAAEQGYNDVAIIRRAVCGTRILGEYDCIVYQSYGLKGETRFPIEMNASGVSDIIIQHGINDIIHPVGVEINPFRPMSNMPTVQDLIDGVRNYYLKYTKDTDIRVWSGTLLPIFGWRTYKDFKNDVRNEFNEWLRTSEEFYGCIDFDKALRDPIKPEAFANGCDSGDHLHPSELAYEKMANIVPLHKMSLQK